MNSSNDGNAARNLPDVRARAQAFQSRHQPAPRKPAPEDLGIRLATVPRGDGVELRVSLATYEGRPYASLRQWERSSDGTWWPSKGKSMSVRIRELGAVVAALCEAMDKVDGMERDAGPPGPRRPGTPAGGQPPGSLAR